MKRDGFYIKLALLLIEEDVQAASLRMHAAGLPHGLLPIRAL